MTVTINGTTGYSGPVGTIGDLTTTGNTTLGDASSDTLTLNGNTASIPNNLNFTGGNIGIGVTPSAWRSGGGVIEINAATNGYFAINNGGGGFLQNAYRDASNFVYKNNGTALYFQLASDGSYVWNKAASGTAGNAITFTQAMTLDASGRLGIGQTSPTTNLDILANNGVARFNSSDANGTYIWFANNGTAKAYIGNGNQIITGGSTNDWGIRAEGNLLFAAGGGTERARIDSSGNFMVGVTSTTAKFHAKGTSTADVLYRLEPYTNAYASKLLISSTSSGDGGIRYGAGGGNDMNVFCYGNLLFNVGSGNISGAVGSEVARIDTSGNLLVATTSASGLSGGVGLRGIANGNPNRNTGAVLSWGASNTAGLPQYIGNWPTGGYWGIGHDSSSGGLRLGVCGADSNGWYWTGYAPVYGGAYTNASDYRLKENIVDYTANALTKVMALRPVMYNMIQPEDDGYAPVIKTEIGFIAHEFQEHVPELVSGEKDGTEADGSPRMQGIDYAKFTAVLVKAIQELKADFDAYKSTHP